MNFVKMLKKKKIKTFYVKILLLAIVRNNMLIFHGLIKIYNLTLCTTLV